MAYFIATVYMLSFVLRFCQPFDIMTLTEPSALCSRLLLSLLIVQCISWERPRVDFYRTAS